MLADVEDLLISGLSPALLQRTYEALSEWHRTSLRTPRDIEPEAVAAYAATRLPATLAANGEVLSQVARARGDWAPRSVLDVGAGLGPGAWAAASKWPTIDRLALYEDAPEIVGAGASLFARSDLEAVRNAHWHGRDWTRPLDERADLLIASYVLGEMTLPREAVGSWWDATIDTLVIIEPGTPAGFERITSARTQLVALGASLVAPCPHADECPLASSGWCHFAVRVNRSRTHRMTKGGTLGSEDEGFSYFAVTRNPPVGTLPPRVIRRPVRRGGRIRVKLCTETGLTETVVAKSNPDYRKARKLRWGDTYTPSTAPKHP